MGNHCNWPEPELIAHPQWPGWVKDLVGPCLMTRVVHESPVLQIQAGEIARHAMLEVRIVDAAAMNGPTLQAHVRNAYLTIARLLDRLRSRHAVCVWNYLPGIHTSTGEGLDRYMVFNAGRHEAFRAWLGGTDHFPQMLPTATGVGHGGDDLVIHLLSCTQPGQPVENPRQKPAYRYSPQHGPLPPCFSRATLLPRGNGSPPLILVGGTASVFGEDSVHRDDLAAQTRETVENLSSLVRAACAAATPSMIGARRGSAESQSNPAPSPRPTDFHPWLSKFRQLRVYLRRREDEGVVLAILREHFTRLDDVELFPAELCRAELRVEIAGLAEVDAEAPA